MGSKDDPTHIPLLENIRKFLKGTIYESPKAVKGKKNSSAKKPKNTK